MKMLDFECEYRYIIIVLLHWSPFLVKVKRSSCCFTN